MLVCLPPCQFLCGRRSRWWCRRFNAASARRSLHLATTALYGFSRATWRHRSRHHGDIHQRLVDPRNSCFIAILAYCFVFSIISLLLINNSQLTGACCCFTRLQSCGAQIMTSELPFTSPAGVSMSALENIFNIQCDTNKLKHLN